MSNLSPETQEKIEKIVEEKKRLIEENTGNRVILRLAKNIDADAMTDFGSWSNMSELPIVLYRPSIDRVHILHELIHLEKFFVEGYQIIAHYDSPNEEEKIEVGRIEKTFKDIPEDYVAHKVIHYGYGFDPIKESYFKEHSAINAAKTDLQLAAVLINLCCFSEFRPKNYKQKANDMLDRAEEVKPRAYAMAKNATATLNEINYRDKDSYNSHLGELIQILAPDYPAIHPSSLVKENNVWRFDP